MKRLALALLLIAAPALADTDKISLANLPACVAGNPISLWVLDSVDDSTCDPEQVGTSDAHCCCANGTWSSCAGSGSGGGNSFVTMNVDNGTDPVADSSTDTLNWTSGTGITITGDSSTDTITIASTIPDLTLDLDADGGTDSTALTEIEFDNNVERLFAKEPSADLLRIDAKAATDRYLSVGPSSLGTAGCEFDGSVCSYTIVSGTASCAGTVDLYAATSGVETCDISTRNGELLLQAGNGTGDDVFLKVDYTIPDGKGVLWKMSGATQGINNSSQCGVGVNNNDTSPQSGAWFEIVLDAQSLGQRALMQSSVGTIGPASLADDVYEHLWGAIVRRDESTDHVYWAWVSVNGGTSWHYLGRSSHASTTMDNVWIYCDTRTAFTTNTPPVSIVSFDYIYEVDDNLFNPY